MTKKAFGKKEILRPDNKTTAEIDLYDNPELVNQASYLIRYFGLRKAIGKGDDFHSFKGIGFYGTEFPDYLETKNGKYFAGVTIHGDEGEGRHSVLIDERLNEHERLATIGHELGHIFGGYPSSSQEKQAHQLAIDTLHSLYSNYETLSDSKIQEVLKKGKVNFDPKQIPKEVIAKALGYLVKSADAFGVRDADLSGQGIVRTRGLERMFGLFLILAGSVLMFSQPLSSITGFAVLSSVSSSLGSWVFILGLGMMLAGMLVMAARLEERLNQDEERNFLFGVGKRSGASQNVEFVDIGLNPADYEKFLSDKQYVQGPAKLGKELVDFYSSYENDAQELASLKGLEKARYVSSKVQELAFDLDRLNEIKRLIDNPWPKVTISEKALERMKKDSTVLSSWERYQDFITQLVKGYGQSSVESIGEFRVSPQGRNMYRLAWNYNEDKNTIEVNDFLYHTSGSSYVDDWARKAQERKITRKTYAKKRNWDGEDLKDII